MEVVLMEKLIPDQAAALTPRARRKRMHNIVAAMQQYVARYDKQPEYENYSDKTFIDDMLYGIGVALDGHKHSFANGFDVWKDKLRTQPCHPRYPSLRGGAVSLKSQSGPEGRAVVDGPVSNYEVARQVADAAKRRAKRKRIALQDALDQYERRER